jgi:hypothetical protein
MRGTAGSRSQRAQGRVGSCSEREPRCLCGGVYRPSPQITDTKTSRYCFRPGCERVDERRSRSRIGRVTSVSASAQQTAPSRWLSSSPSALDRDWRVSSVASVQGMRAGTAVRQSTSRRPADHRRAVAPPPGRGGCRLTRSMALRAEHPDRTTNSPTLTASPSGRRGT